MTLWQPDDLAIVTTDRHEAAGLPLCARVGVLRVDDVQRWVYVIYARRVFCVRPDELRAVNVRGIR